MRWTVGRRATRRSRPTSSGRLREELRGERYGRDSRHDGGVRALSADGAGRGPRAASQPRAGRMDPVRRAGHLRLAEGPGEEPRGGGRRRGYRGACRDRGERRRGADRGDDEPRRGGEAPGGADAFPDARGSGGAGGHPADPPPGDAGRECEPGHALLVLPERVAVLPCGGQHLLRERAGRAQPGAFDLRVEPLRGGHADGYGSGAGGAGCGDGGPERRGHADGAGGEFLHRAEHGHHADDGDGADRSAGGGPYSGPLVGFADVFREGGRQGFVGLRAGECGGGA